MWSQKEERASTEAFGAQTHSLPLCSSCVQRHLGTGWPPLSYALFSFFQSLLINTRDVVCCKSNGAINLVFTLNGEGTPKARIGDTINFLKGPLFFQLHNIIALRSCLSRPRMHSLHLDPRSSLGKESLAATWNLASFLDLLLNGEAIWLMENALIPVF